MLTQYLKYSLLGCMFVSTAYAETVKITPSINPSHSILSIAIGGVNTSNLGASRSFPIINPITDQSYVYAPTKTSKTKPVFELFMGYEFTRL